MTLASGALPDGPGDRVRRVLAADPRIAHLQEHCLEVGAVRQAVGEPARRAETGRRDADPLFQRPLGQADVAGDDLRGRLPLDQPRRPAEAELDVFRARRLDVDVVIRVVADRMPLGDDLPQPADVLLLHRLPQGEEVDDAATRLDPPRGLHGITLGRGVEVSLLVVPVGLVPGGEVPAHLQVERDGDQGLLRGRSAARARAGPAVARPVAERGGQEASSLSEYECIIVISPRRPRPPWVAPTTPA